MAKPSDLHTIIFLQFTHTHTNYTSPATNGEVLSLIACVCNNVCLYICLLSTLYENTCTSIMKFSECMGNGSGITSLNSPGGCTMQRGMQQGSLHLILLVTK